MIVKGKVKDYSGKPIFDATVVVKNSVPLKGVTTDFDGNFEINVEPNTVLEFSHVGTAQKVQKNVGNETFVEIFMMNEIQLEEVVVYGKPKSSCGLLCWLILGFGAIKLYRLSTKEKVKDITI
jgi:iron complex outermembrane receptor protein